MKKFYVKLSINAVDTKTREVFEQQLKNWLAQNNYICSDISVTEEQ